MLRRVLLLFAVAAVLTPAAITTRVYRSVAIMEKEEMVYAQAEGLTLLDRDGNEFFAFNAPGRQTVVPFSDIPHHVVQALIAAEDQNFVNHIGISPTGILRAAYLNVQYGSWRYGGSTITQQLAKNVLLNPRKNLVRKYQEAVFAIKLERYFSKEEILEMYLNTAYFGEQAFGIEEAGQTFFNKPARELSVGEASFLIGLLRAPSALSPFSGDKSLALRRHAYVLRRMAEEGYITPSERDSLVQQPLALAEALPATNYIAPHFALAVRDQLLQIYDEEYVIKSGLRVRTTLNRVWQEHAETVLAEHVDSLARYQATNGAVVVLDPVTNEVRALVGSRSWYEPKFGKVNMATRPRQTGSAFKPVVYAAGLESGNLTAATVLHDKPTTFDKDYKPKNYNNRYRGNVSVRQALANSLNIPTVEAVSVLGPTLVANTAKEFGITSLSPDAPYNLSIGLGTEAVSLLELTNAYAVFADNGNYRPAQFVTSIEDKLGNSVSWSPQSERPVITQNTAFIISSILSDARARAATFGRTLTISHPAAAKTGTTQDYRDAWTVGYTPQLVVGVWIGNNDNTPMVNLPGANGAAPVWRNLMEQYSGQAGRQDFTPPSTLVRLPICPGRGLRARSGGVMEYFVAGTEPRRFCPDPSPTPLPEDQEEGDEESEDVLEELAVLEGL